VGCVDEVPSRTRGVNEKLHHFMSIAMSSSSSSPTPAAQETDQQQQGQYERGWGSVAGAMVGDAIGAVLEMQPRPSPAAVAAALTLPGGMARACPAPPPGPDVYLGVQEVCTALVRAR
jgi:hypothetical protein